MATVGQALTMPETGWKRFDDTDSRFTKMGTWSSETSASYYNGSVIFSATKGDKLSFNFYGSKFRIIGVSNNNRTNADHIQVVVDGINVGTINTYSASFIGQVLQFEYNIGLRGNHKIDLINIASDGKYLSLDALDIDSTGDLISTGSILATVDSSWRRYDDNDSRIIHSGTWTYETNASEYNGGAWATTETTAKMTFKFYGSKIRVLNGYWNNKVTNNIINIDGTDYTFSEYRNISTNCPYQSVVFEKYDLPLGNHTIVISSPNLTAGTNIQIDAIDIDSTGYLMHPLLNQVNSLDNMQVGDCIPCRYTALTSGAVGYLSDLGTCIANEIPTASSATPDGLFYWVYVGKDYRGRKKFIADRNIQHSVSWDTLNSAGIASGVIPVIYDEDSIPTMTSNTSPSGLASCSSTYGTGSDAWNAFSNGGGWCTPVGTTTGWLAYEFPSNKIINIYCINAHSTSPTQSPKNWTFEGWDGTNWVILDTRTNITWVANETKPFTINNSTAYKKYRINITANNGATVVNVYNFRMYEKSNYLRSISLLTGGTSATDTDNEWDKIIVNSTLGGKITAGDDKIWHWNNLYSLASTTHPLGNTYRVSRGYSLVNNYGGGATSGTAYANTGFRPVLLVEHLLTDKFLIKKDSNYYSVKPEYYDVVTHSFLPLTLSGVSSPNKDDVEAFGFDNINDLLMQTSMGGDTFKPKDKLPNNIDIRYYKKLL